MRKILAVTLLAPAVSFAQVYKCTGPDGHTTFSGSPCAGAAQVERLDVKDNRIGGQFATPEAVSSVKGQREVDKILRQVDDEIEAARHGRSVCKNMPSTQVRTLTIRSQIIPGMKVSDALKAWGAPSRINGSQYVYRWGSSQASYFYEEDGCVSNVDGVYRGPKAVR